MADHSKNHQCARLRRWVLKLSEYEFDIIHKPGKQHINSEVLSRHIYAVSATKEIPSEVGNLELTLHVIAHEQSKDEYGTQIGKQIEQETTSRFYIEEHGILICKQMGGKECVIIPGTLVPTVINNHHHDKVWAGYQGIT
jgi:hypothetical protein